MEDAVHFLSKDTVVQAISRSATKVCLIFIYIYIYILEKVFDLYLTFHN